MAVRNEDILVRIRADYAKALADMQRFTGSAVSALDQLPKAVQSVSGSVDRLTERLERMGRNDGPEQLRRRLGQANTEATRLSKTFGELATGGKAIGAAMAGWQAGKMVLMPHLEKQMDYGVKLAHLANITFADQSVAQRIAGKNQLNDTIMTATRGGGSNREDVLTGLDKMIASGVVSAKDAQIMLPSVVRGATAANASPEEIAGIAIRGMQNFGFKAEDLPAMIDMAIKSGNLGGFELKDMARWLPQQMAEASALGMKGKDGFAQLLSLNQAAITTAGTTDAAGNNVVNLLAKINSTDTQKDFKRQGIDLTGSLQAAIGKGIDPVTAFSKLIDNIMLKDKGYQVLEAKLKGASSDKEKTDIITQQLQLAEGTAIGKVLQDRQARAAYLGFKKQGDQFTKMTDATLNGSAGTVDKNYAVIDSESGSKRQQALNETLNAQTTALNKLNPALNKYYDYVTKAAQAHPALTAAVEGGKIAVTTLAAAAGTAAIALALLSKNARGAAGQGAGGAAGGGAGGTGAPGIVARAIGGLKVAGPMAVVGAGVDAYSIYNNDKLTALEKKIGYTGAVGGALGGALGGAAAGAALGSVFPLVGTAIGGVIGAGLGYLGGQKAGTAVGESMFGESNGPSPEKVQNAWSEKSKLNSLESRLQMQTAFNTMASPIALPPAVNAVPNRATPPLIALPPVVNAVPNMAMQKQTASPIAAPQSFSESAALKKQMAGPGANTDAVQRALIQGLKPLPLDARLKVDVSFNEMNKPYVAQQSLTGKGIRLDTGPMMTH